MNKVSRREAVSKVVAGGAGLALLNLKGVDVAGAAEQGTAAAQGQTPPWPSRRRPRPSVVGARKMAALI